MENKRTRRLLRAAPTKRDGLGYALAGRHRRRVIPWTWSWCARVQSVNGTLWQYHVLTTRKPRLLLRFPGWLLLRFADRTFLAELFQLPPRITRFEPVRE